MHIFISAGEPSGDLHGSNLTRALLAADPSMRITGFGGDRMRLNGCNLLYPLAEHSVMGFVRVVGVVPHLADLLERFTDHLHRTRPDAVVLIDYPGYHWWLAARAKQIGIPVVSFVPPQIWGWATHRVKRIRKYFDRVLCSLPFETDWYHERNVPQAEYVGHPYFDELPQQKLDPLFMAVQGGRSGPIVALLPGSRTHEVKHNWPSMLATARQIHNSRPDVRFLVACYREDHRRHVESELAGTGLCAVAHVHKTPEIIEVSSACIAVSGSVGLELLYRTKPTVVIYRTTPFYKWLKNRVAQVPYISLVNLLANEELFPEFFTDREVSEGPAQHVLNWLEDSGPLTAKLSALKEKVAAPGACDRTAQILLEMGRPVRQAA